jgi:hypothetical protein
LESFLGIFVGKFWGRFFEGFLLHVTYEDLVLTPKFGKESDLWVRLDEESVRWKEGFSQMYSAKGSAVGYPLPFGKGTVELILRDWTVTWLKLEGRMDG